MNSSSRPERGVHRVRAASFSTGMLLVSLACLAGSSADRDSALDPGARAVRISELEASIERDHRALENFVAQARTEAAPALHEDPELREIAERIIAETRLLESLRNPSGGPAVSN